MGGEYLFTIDAADVNLIDAGVSEVPEVQVNITLVS